MCIKNDINDNVYKTSYMCLLCKYNKFIMKRVIRECVHTQIMGNINNSVLYISPKFLIILSTELQVQVGVRKDSKHSRVLQFASVTRVYLYSILNIFHNSILNRPGYLNIT